MPDSAITRKQLKALHAGFRFLSINRVEKLGYLGSYLILPCVDRELAGRPAESTKHLSRRQARQLITRLQQRGFPIGRPYSGSPVDRSHMDATIATPAQSAQVKRLREEIAWRTEHGFEAWLMTRLSMERIRTFADAERVIEGLKGLKRHGHAAAE